MSTKRYNLSSRQQLIDINNDITNFEANISVASLDQIPFDAIVVSQKELEASPKLDFKHVEQGIFGVNISQNKNEYENFFLVLRSDNPTEVDVVIEVTELPLFELPASQPVQQVPIQQVPEQQPPAEILDSKSSDRKKKSFFQSNWKIIVIGLILIIGGAVLWYFYKIKKPEKGSMSFDIVKKQPNFEPSVIVETPKVDVPATVEDNSVDPELLGKLNNMFS